VKISVFEILLKDPNVNHGRKFDTKSAGYLSPNIYCITASVRILMAFVYVFCRNRYIIYSMSGHFVCLAPMHQC